MGVTFQGNISLVHPFEVAILDRNIDEVRRLYQNLTELEVKHSLKFVATEALSETTLWGTQWRQDMLDLLLNVTDRFSFSAKFLSSLAADAAEEDDVQVVPLILRAAEKRGYTLEGSH